jgi:glycogen synthase
MKIAIVASDYAPTVGGVQTAVRNIAHHSVRLGHCVTLLSYRPSGKAWAYEVEDGVPIHRLPWGRRPIYTLPLRALWTLVQMARLLREFKPDVVYVHFLSVNALYVLLLHYFMNFRLIASARGNDIQGIPERSRIQRWMLTHLFRRADAILFCSSFVCRDAAPYLRGISSHTFVGIVGDGFYPEEFQRHAAFRYRSSYILGMGRLVHKKGFDLLIRAFSHVAPEFPKLELLIAGDGSERSALERLTEELGLRDRVTCLGFADRDKTIALFFGCEFFVLSSRVEPFGIVVLEAMAAHKAVLATKSGGVVDLVQDQVNGLLVDRTVEALTTGLRVMLSNPDKARAMGARAYATIEQRTWQNVTRQYLSIFEDVVKARSQ